MLFCRSSRAILHARRAGAESRASAPSSLPRSLSPLPGPLPSPMRWIAPACFTGVLSPSSTHLASGVFESMSSQMCLSPLSLSVCVCVFRVCEWAFVIGETRLAHRPHDGVSPRQVPSPPPPETDKPCRSRAWPGMRRWTNLSHDVIPLNVPNAGLFGDAAAAAPSLLFRLLVQP